MPRLLLFIPLVLFIVLGAFLWKGLSIDPRELPSALLNKPFPAFKVAALRDANKILTKADFMGKPVLVNVWATWCPSCRKEHAQLLAIAKEARVPVIGLNYKDDRNAALAWLEQLGDPYQFNIFDERGMLGLDLGVYGAPETYLLDEKGIIRYRQVGVMTAQAWAEFKVMLDKGWQDEAI
ncbi:MAG: DsbE family thiol:disulfide interchange protein [Methylococcales bacterium]|nr:DsbE family thiol:disulfide interchange protein [Methylococcales bacterium]